MQSIAAAISKVISYDNEGIAFLFGGLADQVMLVSFLLLKYYQALSFLSLISLLYYIGVMQWIIKIIGGALQKLLGTSKAESMSAAANIFVGQTEAPLIVKPYISKMTESELLQ